MKKSTLLNPLLAVVAFFLTAVICPASDAAKGDKKQENRFLFLVDTSAAMRRYSTVIVQDVGQLLESDMNGEFRRSDTIGLWTYNDTLHPEFPMQVWSKEDKSTITDDMTAFLRARRYESRAHFERALPALEQVITNSERITIIWISDGTGVLRGTPFDKEINGLQKKYGRELRAAHKPVVIVLAGREGVVYDYTINYPGLVAIPHTAYPEKPVEPVAPLAAVATPPPAVIEAPAKIRMGQSIIVTGPTHHAAQAAAPPPAPVAAPVVAPPVAQTVPAPAPVPVVVAASTPAPVSESSAVTPAAPPQASAPVESQPAQAPPVAPAPVPQAPPAPVAVDGQQPQSVPTPVRSAPIATAAEPGSAPLALFVMAFSLLTIAVVLVVFLIRRSRGAPQASLISQSIDRPR